MRVYVSVILLVCLAFGSIVASDVDNPPAEVNWVSRGAVPPVRDVGMCGSDWAFAASGAVEAAHAIFGKGLVSASEQQLLDCAATYGGKGCGGAMLGTAFEYIAANGVTTSDVYPYKGSNGTCRFNGGPIKIKSYTVVPKGDCEALKTAVARQPVMAVVDGMSLFHYRDGVLSTRATNLDHAVLVVGYTPDYWLVQNNWGPNWGEHGYFRLKRGNTIGICELAAYPNY